MNKILACRCVCLCLKVQIVPFGLSSQLDDKSQIIEQEKKKKKKNYSKQVLNGHLNPLLLGCKARN